MADTDAFAGDKLERKADAELLTALLTSEPRPQVISVDARWGGGKTTFVQMWAKHLIKAAHPVVIFNAWETDYVDDPLVAFVGELQAQLLVLHDAGAGNERLRQHWRRAKALGLGVIRAAGPLALRVATQGVMDAQTVRNALGFVADVDAPISDYVAKVAEERLEAYAKERVAVASFRDTLAAIAGEITGQAGVRAPVVVFVDELDRCRPSFAVALLERIKHLFSVPGVVFVLALDREQLAHAVRAIYGAGFGAEGYLRRFIDFDYRLPAQAGEPFVEYLAERHEVLKVYQANIASRDEYQTLVANFVTLSRLFDLSLRDQEQAFQRIVLALKSAPSEKHYLYTNLMLFLGVLRWGDPGLYHRYMAGVAQIADILDCVRQRPGGAKYLNTHSGHVVQAYLLLSARRDSDARSIITDLSARVENEAASQEDRTTAANILEAVRRFSTVGGSAALQAALARLEKINARIQVDEY